MVIDKRTAAGALLYGALWAIAAPVALVWWADSTTAVVALPAVYSPWLGTTLGSAGLLLMGSGIAALALYGRGLPMNPFPPPHYVARGIYGWISHPIYVGFVILVVGVAVRYGSASGLWLVAPVTALVLAALVVGYEQPDLRRRFGARVHRPRLALPRAADGHATAAERTSVYVLVLLPWLIAYEAVQLLGVPTDAIASHLPFERSWPVIEWTEAIYATAYLVVLAAPLLVRERRALRHFALTGLIATGIVTLIYVTVPFIAPPRPFEPTTLLGRLHALERATSNTVGAFPAFHVIWPLIAARALASRGRAWGMGGYAWAAVIAVSCITTGIHSVADIVFAAILFVPLSRHDRVWERLRAGSERLANSWREWRIGPVRVINHGFYSSAGALIGFWLTGWLAGIELLLPLLALSFFSLICAALWAQFVEGSPALLRPLGYYGGIFGGLAGTAGLALLNVNVLVVLGALAVALPWIQAAGRLRCLVQGCCHGGPATDATGIRYRHSRSRVTQIAGLAGVPLHPTPLYSILSNVVTGVLLLRLWLVGAAPVLVVGLYFVLNAVARFVEEAYRAEPQTPVIAGLRLYQWLAVIGLLLGVGFTTLPTPVPAPRGDPFDGALLTGAVAVALFTWFLTAVDFPESSRRFSRLAAADAPPRLLGVSVATAPPEPTPQPGVPA